MSLPKSKRCKRWCGICQGSQSKELKIKKKIIICDEKAWTNKLTEEQAQGRTDFGVKTARWKRLYVSLRQWNAIAAIDIFTVKRVFL